MDTLSARHRIKIVHCMDVYVGVCNGSDISVELSCVCVCVRARTYRMVIC